MRKLLSILLLFPGFAFQTAALADDECGPGRTTVQLVQDDLSDLKQKVDQAIAAVPTPASPYGKARERWSLPGYACQDGDGFLPLAVGYSSEYTTEAAVQAEGQKFQQALMQAQAQGDYKAMMEISQKMQQAIARQTSQNKAMKPIDISVYGNVADAATIDPGSVVRSDAGFVAIRLDTNLADGEEEIAFYFDPVKLRDSKTMASFDLGENYRLGDKLGLLNLKIDLTGPESKVESMTKQLDVGRVMDLLTASRKVL